MNEIDIRKYAGLMRELGLTGLEITEDNKTVRLERSAPPAVKEIVAVETSRTADTVTAGGESAGPRGPPAVFYRADAQRREPDERERGEEAEFCPRDVRVALEPRPERQGEEHEADELVREPARRIFHAAILAHLAPCAQRRLALLSSRGCSDVF